MHRSRRAFLRFAGGLPIAPPLIGQSPAAFRSNVEMVIVPCTVVDANGTPVRDLTRDEFRVFDNDVRRVVESFSIDTDVPLTLGVIIDGSPSQEDQFAEHRQATLEILERILHPGDRAFVIFLDEDVKLWVDLTGDTAEVRKKMVRKPSALFGDRCPVRKSSIPELKPISACGPTPLWNAIYDAARIKLQPLKGNKALLILTDGFDSGSTHSWSQAATAVERADTSLFAIQYRSASGRSFSPDLSRLVTETAGALLHAPDGDYGKVISRIETDLRGRFVLGFRPEQLSGKSRHEVRVEVTRPDLTVRARKTYFREPR